MTTAEIIANDMNDLFTRTEYATWTWEGIKNLIDHMESEGLDSRSKMFQLFGYMEASMETYEKLERY